APRAADSSRAAAAQRRPSVEKDASDETARRAEHSFALHPLAPLNLEAAQARLMQQVADGRRVAVLRRFDMPEIPPDALRALAGGAATEKDARRLLRTYERSFRVDSVRGPAPRSNGGGRPAVHVEMSAPPAPERAPKVKGQSRIACAAPAPDAPQPASSVHVETFTNGFSN
ncbi:MAG TPA: hypothetical protein VER08_06725, partial [Pyrinomonadaceae bacterium]|nr:hypothetical protein [Pyrinomonadaceae bacterium]